MRQHSRTRRRLVVGAFGLAAAPLLLASVATACTQLTNLAVNPKSGAAGVTVALSGSNYRTEATAGPVEIRLDSRTGPVIASLPTSSINPIGRTISLDAPIPASAALGYHTLIATQTNTSTGALIGGFPVRAAYKVTAVAAGKAASTAAEATEPVGTTETALEPGAAPAGPGAPAGSTAPAAAPGAASTVDSRTTAPAVGTSASEASGSTPLAANPAAPGAPGTGPAAAARPAGAFAAAPPGGAASPAATAAPAASAVETRGRGLIPAGASASPSVLPALTLALALAVVLLSLAACVRSGRSVLVGRRLPSLA